MQQVLLNENKEVSSQSHSSINEAYQKLTNQHRWIMCLIVVALIHLIFSNWAFPDGRKLKPEGRKGRHVTRRVNFTLVISQHNASFEEARVLLKSMLFNARQHKQTPGRRIIRLNILTDPVRKLLLHKFFHSFDHWTENKDDVEFNYPSLEVYYQAYTNEQLKKKLSQIWKINFDRIPGHPYHGYFTLAKAAMNSLFDEKVVQGYNIFVDTDSMFTDDPFTMWNQEKLKMIQQKTAIHMPGNCSCVMMLDFERMKTIQFSKRIGRIFHMRFTRRFPPNGDQRLFVLVKSAYPYDYSRLDGRWEMSGCQHLIPFEETSSWDMRFGIFHFNCCFIAKNAHISVFEGIVQGKCFRGMGKYVKRYMELDLKGINIRVRHV